MGKIQKNETFKGMWQTPICRNDLYINNNDEDSQQNNQEVSQNNEGFCNDI